jgi:outer membrane protein
LNPFFDYFGEERKEVYMQRGVFLSIVCCVAMILGLSMPSYAADNKVGYINLQRLVNESEMGKKAKEDIQKLRTEKETELKGKLREINGLRALINEQGESMDFAERRDKEQELNRAYKDYQRLLEDAKEDISNEDQELVSIILQKADGVLKEVAKKKYSIILKDPDAIGYLDPSVDITDDVLKELNK